MSISKKESSNYPQPPSDMPDFDAIENMRRADRGDRTVEQRDFEDMDLDCEINIGRDIGPPRNNND